MSVIARSKQWGRSEMADAGMGSSSNDSEDIDFSMFDTSVAETCERRMGFR